MRYLFTLLTFLLFTNIIYAETAYIINLPPDAGEGNPVIWFETHAAWEQSVCIYENVGSQWILKGTVAKSGEGGKMKSFTLSSSATYRKFLVWMTHKTSEWDPSQGWINSQVKILKKGKNDLVSSESSNYRDKTIVIGSEDGADSDYNDGITHFTYISISGAAKVESYHHSLPDGFINARNIINIK